ncbi:hypothetical protein [Variovorax paradoxus]|uniref:Uncharacterized protein n=1 Tax=Variovorax paradoxus TaxID=34073 RepID=A0A6I6H2B2_VARPD|nr:hypothetical protein [Variovorax paradoxus]QGW80942.1 hypothetical protein GOQ09_04805 [Variovorax paradoxus]
MKLFQLPQLLKDDVPLEKRLDLIRTIGKDAREKFAALYPQTTKWVTEYDPVYLLSMCAFYLIAYPEGTDREATGELEFHHHYLELLQAFALCQPRSYAMQPLREQLLVLKAHMQEVGEHMALRSLEIPERLTSDKEISAYQLRTEMMAQTTAVRNWAYMHQMTKVLLDLAHSIEPAFQAAYGVAPHRFFSMLLQITEEAQDRLNAHMTKMRECAAKRDYRTMIVAYNDAFPENMPITEEQAAWMWKTAGKKRRNLLSMLLMHADLKLERVYSFSLDRALELVGEGTEKAALQALLEKISFRFGDLADANKEHFVLSNPVLDRPFISLGDGVYFSAVWGVLPHLLLDILEDLVWEDKGLRDLYTKSKALYLEDELERIVRAGFPNGQVFTGSTWQNSAGVTYENDLTVVVDSFAIVFEAKSASVSDPARRGAPSRLAETLRELIESPSEQALRFIDRLKSEPGIHEFRTKRGVVNEINSGAIKHYIPIGVTLSHLGLIASNLKKLIAAGIVDKKLEDLAPSISITDLESVFELLTREVEKVHYLARRREFEAHMNYEGDELDLLGFYLENGFNIGDTEYSQDLVLNMVLKSKELDPYFIGSREGHPVPKPRLAMTHWWDAILNRVNEAKFEGWLETGFILLNTTREDQAKFEVEFKKLARQVQEGTASRPHNWLIWASGPKRRRYVVVGYPYVVDDKEQRNSILGEAIESVANADARGVAAIGVNMKHPQYPYDVLARRAATNLFDTLTLDARAVSSEQARV